jgi:Mg/Co/Ni transporter MgtE
LPNRRTTRANDLWLEFENEQLVMRGIDTRPQAIFRRLLRKTGNETQQEVTDWKQIEFLRGDPQAAREEAGYRRNITNLQPAEIAALSEALPYLHAAELLVLLPDPLAADVLEAMSDERELQVFEELDEQQGIRLLSLMAPDAAADLIARLYPDETQRYLEKLPRMQSERIIELLRYPEDSVGGVMTNDIVFAPASLTIGEAREYLREPLKAPDFIHFVYVVEDEASRLLRGVLSLRDLLVAEAEALLEQVMKKDVMTLDPLASASAAAYQLLSSHLAALPVIAKDRRLLGVMTIDAAVALAAPNSWRTQAPKVFS